MANDQSNPIGLAELIEQVKQELLTPSAEEDDVPLLSVDSVELELQVTVQRQDGGKIKINVMSLFSGELADKFSKDNMHKVKVTLSPLVDKQKLIALYLQRNPEKKEEIIKASTELLKNPSHEAGEGF
ncbi:trypco2 family protein [Nostoc sp.]|uniref:trypco2 family protein n=1 Tax=Nostoc sp. TaxID=1180 RepID=UPI002FF7E003